MTFGDHLDTAIRAHPVRHVRICADRSAALFLVEPDSCGGGERIVKDTYGTHTVELPAGDMALYPSAGLHRVAPITRGSRVASLFWIQSMIRDDAQRTVLCDLNMAIVRLTNRRPRSRRSSA